MKYEDIYAVDLQAAYENDGLISVCDGDEGSVEGEKTT